MKLKIMLPYKTILDKEIYKLSAPGIEGDFQILPKHIDGTWVLEAGVLIVSMDKDKKVEWYYAISEGVLVKEKDTIYLTCFQAIKGDTLEGLVQTVKDDLSVLKENEKKAKSALVRLEADTIKRFIDYDN